MMKSILSFVFIIAFAHANPRFSVEEMIANQERDKDHNVNDVFTGDDCLPLSPLDAARELFGIKEGFTVSFNAVTGAKRDDAELKEQLTQFNIYLTKLLGSGKDGRVYIASVVGRSKASKKLYDVAAGSLRFATNKKRAVKLIHYMTSRKVTPQELHEKFRTEVRAQITASELVLNGRSIAPRVRRHGMIPISDTPGGRPHFLGVIVMDLIPSGFKHPHEIMTEQGTNVKPGYFPAYIKIMQQGKWINGDGILSRQQIETVRQGTALLNSRCLIHMGTDFHSDNVFMSSDPKNPNVIFIDFGTISLGRVETQEGLDKLVSFLLGLGGFHKREVGGRGGMLDIGGDSSDSDSE